MRIVIRLLWVVPLVACLGYVLSRLLVFKQIFFAHAGIAITQPEVVAAYPGIAAKNPQHIPKIIHQVFHNWKVPGNDTLPAGWAETRQTCIDLNPHFEIKVRIHTPPPQKACGVHRVG